MNTLLEAIKELDGKGKKALKESEEAITKESIKRYLAKDVDNRATITEEEFSELCELLAEQAEEAKNDGLDISLNFDDLAELADTGFEESRVSELWDKFMGLSDVSNSISKWVEPANIEALKKLETYRDKYDDLINKRYILEMRLDDVGDGHGDGYACIFADDNDSLDFYQSDSNYAYFFNNITQEQYKRLIDGLLAPIKDPNWEACGGPVPNSLKQSEYRPVIFDEYYDDEIDPTDPDFDPEEFGYGLSPNEIDSYIDSLDYSQWC